MKQTHKNALTYSKFLIRRNLKRVKKRAVVLSRVTCHVTKSNRKKGAIGKEPQRRHTKPSRKMNYDNKCECKTHVLAWTVSLSFIIILLFRRIYAHSNYHHRHQQHNQFRVANGWTETHSVKATKNKRPNENTTSIYWNTRGQVHMFNIGQSVSYTRTLCLCVSPM